MIVIKNTNIDYIILNNIKNLQIENVVIEKINIINNKLQTLVIKDSLIIDLTDEDIFFKHLMNLFFLSITGSRINDITRIDYNYLNNLEILILNNNNIEEITNDTFKNLNKLKYLDLSYNLITTIENKSFKDCSEICTIDLSFNKLKYLDKDLIKDLHFLRLFILLGNPKLLLTKNYFTNFIITGYYSVNND
jgi:Leucine-rich repeat (LRR) protein